MSRANVKGAESDARRSPFFLGPTRQSGLPRPGPGRFGRLKLNGTTWFPAASRDQTLARGNPGRVVPRARIRSCASGDGPPGRPPPALARPPPRRASPDRSTTLDVPDHPQPHEYAVASPAPPLPWPDTKCRGSGTHKRHESERMWINRRHVWTVDSGPGILPPTPDERYICWSGCCSCGRLAGVRTTVSPPCAQDRRRVCTGCPQALHR